MRVFVFARTSDRYDYDISFFSRIENYALIIEEYIDNDDIIELFSDQLSKSRIIATARTSANQAKFSEVFGGKTQNIFEFDVNKILERDIDETIKYINSAGFWSKIDNASSKRERTKYIRQYCNLELQSISLGIIKSTAQHEKIRSYFRAPITDSHSSVILSLILTYFEMSPTYEFISELLGIDMFSVREEFRETYIADLFAMSGHAFEARSSVLAKYILQNFVSDRSILEIISRALSVSSTKYKMAERYRTFNSKAMQYSNIKSFVRDSKNQYEKIRLFYDEVGEFGYKENSPYYWLQYGIASKLSNRFEKAERCYEEALRIAVGKQNFYLYKLESSYAEFLLDSREKTEHWNDYSGAFIEASKLARSHIAIRETGHYPIIVAEKMPRYLDRRKSIISKSGLRDIKKELEYWVECLEKFNSKSRSAQRRLDRIITTCLDIVRKEIGRI